MKAAILARVSSSEQATPDRHSLPGQVAKMQAYAEAKGWQVSRVFEIPGESAYTDNLLKRPEFANAIEAAERGEFSHLLIDEASRFARDQYLFHDSMRRLRKAGVQLWAVSMDMELSANPLMAGIFAAVAEESSRLQGAKIAAAKSSRFARGLHTADIPFGYESAGPGMPARVVEAEAAALKRVFERYLATGSLIEVTRELNASGLRPHSKQGKIVFETTSVQRMLSNRFYIGEVLHRGERGVGAHVPILDAGLFEEVQSRMKTGGTRVGPTQQLCTGFIVCGACQRKMVTQRSEQNWYYRDKREAAFECANQRKGMSASRVEGEIEAIFGNIDWQEPAYLEYVNGRQRRTGSVVASAERSALAEERKRVNQMYQRGFMEPGEYEAAIAEIRSRMDVLPVELGALWQANAKVSSLRDVWSKASLAAKRALLQEVLEYVEADARTLDVRIVPREGYTPLFAARATYVAECCGGTPGRNRAERRNLYSISDLVGVAV